ncbi:MAG: hypothetical protein MK188_14470, partial [Gammaproteobacteria bacterium]|nr:hypothetical protein [Gammaproteobacteria bacterium]
SEALIDNRWIRFDATAATSPERIEYGMSALLELWGGGYYESNNTAQGLSDFLNPSGSERAWRKIVETWSNVQYQWKKWVVDYDANAQRQLLQKLGLTAKNSLTTLITILVMGVSLLLGLYFWQLLPKPQELNDLQKLYKKYTHKIRKADVTISDALTPNEIATKLVKLYPDQAETIANITIKFNTLNYGPDLDLESKLNQQLNKEILNLKLVKKKV